MPSTPRHTCTGDLPRAVDSEGEHTGGRDPSPASLPGDCLHRYNVINASFYPIHTAAGQHRAVRFTGFPPGRVPPASLSGKDVGFHRHF